MVCVWGGGGGANEAGLFLTVLQEPRLSFTGLEKANRVFCNKEDG